MEHNGGSGGISTPNQRNGTFSNVEFVKCLTNTLASEEYLKGVSSINGIVKIYPLIASSSAFFLLLSYSSSLALFLASFSLSFSSLANFISSSMSRFSWLVKALPQDLGLRVGALRRRFWVAKQFTNSS